MCGLVYMHNLRKKPVSGKVVKRYMGQRSRGSQGFGIYRPLYDKMAHNPEERKMLKHMRKIQDPILMFHHRFPTSPRANVRNACHPFSTKDFFDTEYILMHNGMISNKQAMFEKHTRLGIKYVSLQPDGKEFCDSECLLWELALYLEGKQDKLDCYGSIAFICYVKGTQGKPRLVFGRNTNPMKMTHGKNVLSLASQGDGKDIDANKLYTYHYAETKLTVTPLNIPTYVNSTYTPGSYAANGPTAGGSVNSGFRDSRESTQYHSPHTPSAPPAAISTVGTPRDTEKTYRTDPPANTTNIHTPKVDVRDTPALVSRISTSAKKAEKAMADLIKTEYQSYLTEARGNYGDAMELLLEDMDRAEEESGDQYEILKQVYNMLENDPWNIGDDALHPDFITEQFPTLKTIGFDTSSVRDAGEEG